MKFLNFKKFEKYAIAKSLRFQLFLTLLFFVSYSCIIIFGFTNMSQQIEQSGYSTADLQNAATRNEVEVIVGAWQSVIPFVNRLYIFDYLFILTGVLLFFSLNALLLKFLKNKGNIQIIPKIGLVLTIFSRTFDALENLFMILIYTNPSNFNLTLLNFLSVTSVFKWILVAFEYSVMGIGWVLLLVLTIIAKKNNQKQVETTGM
ncbi:hypothetical protein DSAG12_03214 [Promethearchaeum syntrophicum]|uniref:Uncharacterized protein n=1 Tax=Promethearchaeum syntrophicum TaxID=2594042 RepID=A0A5B9DEF6_9ARCH|nr:hypothetical protein [Candidatus Prometheoarchaeum syntrophicum]QEE17381.1 hypothetical protein DSAG12_03214 [Candidatus Prometheoarchaeum syntrophicum]